MSIAGVNRYQIAELAQSYQINTSGPVALSQAAFYSYGNSVNINSAINAAFQDQITRLRGNHFETQWGGMMNSSLQTRTAINAALTANALPVQATFRTTGNSLSSQLKMVARLVNAGAQLVNFVEYGFQVENLPIGLSGGQWQLLSAATPGATNAATNALGSTSNLRVNEWMANPSSGNDWFELYNLDPLPVSLAGLTGTDDLSVAGISNTVVALSPACGVGGPRRTARACPHRSCW